jgi:plasmid stabilization system protein ParE
VKAKFLRQAEAELREAIRWYQAHSPGMDVRFLDAVSAAQFDIEDHPERFSRPPAVQTKRDVRRRLLKGFPYSIIYEIRAKDPVLLILAIAHGRRKPGYWIRRRP